MPRAGPYRRGDPQADAHHHADAGARRDHQRQRRRGRGQPVHVQGVETLPEAAKVHIYQNIYTLALIIPVISVLGVGLAGVLRIRDVRRLQRKGFSRAEAHDMLSVHNEAPAPNWWILGGSLVFVAFTLTMGLVGRALEPGDHLRGFAGDHPVSDEPPGEGAGTARPATSWSAPPSSSSCSAPCRRPAPVPPGG